MGIGLMISWSESIWPRDRLRGKLLSEQDVEEDAEKAGHRDEQGKGKKEEGDNTRPTQVSVSRREKQRMRAVDL
jgi:hypothetical protein